MGLKTLWAFIAGAVVVSVLNSIAPHDDTDPAGGRSGLVVRTDALTGCQYLAGAFGGVTPRLDGHGAQIGCRAK